jgi:SHS2 domain-containing protein
LSGGYKPIEHSSDIGIRVWGSSLKELFEEAANGMVSQIIDTDNIQQKEEIKLELEAESFEELLLKWLKEILFLMESEGLLFKEFQIEKDNFSIRNAKTAQIQASMSGEKKNPTRHDICMEIKAVTRHGLYVKKNGPWWEGNILFDV